MTREQDSEIDFNQASVDTYMISQSRCITYMHTDVFLQSIRYNHPYAKLIPATAHNVCSCQEREERTVQSRTTW